MNKTACDVRVPTVPCRELSIWRPIFSDHKHDITCEKNDVNQLMDIKFPEMHANIYFKRLIFERIQVI